MRDIMLLVAAESIVCFTLHFKEGKAQGNTPELMDMEEI